MFTRTLALATFALGLLTLAGCSSAPKLEKVGVRIKSIAPSEKGTEITLLFVNPNNVPLVVASAEHTLSLDGTLIGVIKTKKALGIPPLGTVVEVSALTGPAAEKVTRFAAAHPGSTLYNLKSTLRLNWDDDLFDYKTVDEGRVTLP